MCAFLCTKSAFPAASGPRWLMASVMGPRMSSPRFLEKSQNPAIPHIISRLNYGLDAKKHLWCRPLNDPTLCLLKSAARLREKK